MKIKYNFEKDLHNIFYYHFFRCAQKLFFLVYTKTGEMSKIYIPVSTETRISLKSIFFFAIAEKIENKNF